MPPLRTVENGACAVVAGDTLVYHMPCLHSECANALPGNRIPTTLRPLRSELERVAADAQRADVCLSCRAKTAIDVHERIVGVSRFAAQPRGVLHIETVASASAKQHHVAAL
jgi:hypothetical protein